MCKVMQWSRLRGGGQNKSSAALKPGSSPPLELLQPTIELCLPGVLPLQQLRVVDSSDASDLRDDPASGMALLRLEGDLNFIVKRLVVLPLRRLAVSACSSRISGGFSTNPAWPSNRA
mmetsp:Transcript_19824/g.52139  ORF Transcript_19824/g.52139 Transcript_19824/m.52139 type:complete len:118 (-) Transcript_19824:40-393(-)